MKIYIGCDHAGLDLKLKVIAAFPEFEWVDMGTHTTESIDYPDYADAVSREIVKADAKNLQAGIEDSLNGKVLGVLICGSGQGMAIRANKYKNIRAALCWDPQIAALAREHNNANILCLSARYSSFESAIEMISAFTSTPFSGGRHQQRVSKLSSDTNC